MKRSSFLRVVLLAGFLTLLCPSQQLRADNGYEGWLRYAPLKEKEGAKFGAFPSTLVVGNDSPLLQTSQKELIRGVRGMLGRELTIEKELPKERAIVLGTLADLRSLAPELHPPVELRTDGYWLTSRRIHGQECIIVAGATDRNALRSFCPASQARACRRFESL